MKRLNTVLACAIVVLLALSIQARLRNPWILGDRDLNLWSVGKMTTTHDNCPEFPAYNTAALDPWFKAFHDTVCVGEMRWQSMFGEWGGNASYTRKNEYHSHDGQNYMEDPLGVGTSGDVRVYDPVKYFNVFNYGYCMYYGASSVNMYQMLGLEARQMNLQNSAHRVSDVYYNGGWHYFDWNEGGWAANSQGVTYGLDWAIMNAANWDQVPVKSNYYWTYATNGTSFIKGALANPYYMYLGADHGGGADMSFSLRIGEKLERFFQPINNSYIHSLANPATYSVVVWGNARMTYHPTLQAGYADYLDGIYEQSNATLGSNGVDLTNGSVTWAVRIPYPIYNSTITVTQTGGLTTQLSFDLGKTWVAYSDPTQPKQRYDYLVKVSGTGRISDLNIVTISSLSPGALPKIHSGSNVVRLNLYNNDETLTLVPDWRTSAGFNLHCVATSNFTYSTPDPYIYRNNGQTNGGGTGSYMTMELTGPATGQVVSASGNFVTNRTRGTSFDSRASNTFDIKVGNSQSTIVTTTTAPPHVNTTATTMDQMEGPNEYGFGHWGHAINFERDPITNPGRLAYVQLLNRGQSASVWESELYQHYYVNHLSADYLNDIKIRHVTNRTATVKDTFDFTITAEEIATGNGTVTYNINPSSVFAANPNDQVVMEVTGGVLLTDLQSHPTSAVEQAGSATVAEVALEQNNPNPFNPTTTISFSLAGNETRYVELSVYNLKGELVKMLHNGSLAGGNYSVAWDGTNGKGIQAASGVYLYKLTAGKSNLTRRMILTR